MKKSITALSIISLLTQNIFPAKGMATELKSCPPGYILKIEVGDTATADKINCVLGDISYQKDLIENTLLEISELNQKLKIIKKVKNATIVVGLSSMAVTAISLVGALSSTTGSALGAFLGSIYGGSNKVINNAEKLLKAGATYVTAAKVSGVITAGAGVLLIVSSYEISQFQKGLSEAEAKLSAAQRALEELEGLE